MTFSPWRNEMKDYLDLRLFPKDGVDFLTTLNETLYAVMTVSKDVLSFEQNLIRHRDLGESIKSKYLNFIVYGHDGVDDRILMLLNSSQKKELGFYALLRHHTFESQQKGFCLGYNIAQKSKFVLADQEYLDGKEIPDFDGTVGVFDQWAENIYPDFKAKGYFPRNVIYITQKLYEHGL
jgi:hypothetical protein